MGVQRRNRVGEGSFGKAVRGLSLPQCASFSVAVKMWKHTSDSDSENWRNEHFNSTPFKLQLGWTFPNGSH